MLSLARSRYTLIAQCAFATVNGVGVLLGCIYNASTPDLYPNNAHHKLGWIATWVVGTQVLISFLARVAGVLSQRAGLGLLAQERQSFIPVSAEAMAEHESRFPTDYRFSNDSGQGTERHTESLRSHSLSSGPDSPSFPPRVGALRGVPKEYEEAHEEEDDFESQVPKPLRGGALGSVIQKLAGLISSKFRKGFIFGCNFVDRTILILSFITLCTGVVTFGRFFVSPTELTGGVCHRCLTLENYRRDMVYSQDWRTG